MLDSSTSTLKEKLVKLNSHNLLTISRQRSMSSRMPSPSADKRQHTMDSVDSGTDTTNSSSLKRKKSMMMLSTSMNINIITITTTNLIHAQTLKTKLKPSRRNSRLPSKQLELNGLLELLAPEQIAMLREKQLTQQLPNVQMSSRPLLHPQSPNLLPNWLHLTQRDRTASILKLSLRSLNLKLKLRHKKKHWLVKLML